MYAGDYRCPLSCFAIACRATDGAMGFFAAASGVKYDRAVKCLTKDRADLLAFNGLPAGHCKHVRPTNPMIRTDPTVRHQARNQSRLITPSPTFGHSSVSRQTARPWVCAGIRPATTCAMMVAAMPPRSRVPLPGIRS